MGKTVYIPDFSFEYAGIPPMLKVSVMGTGSYLGFRGDLQDNGDALVWFENGAGSRAKNLVKLMTKMHPGLIDGNKLSARVSDFVDRYATKK